MHGWTCFWRFLVVGKGDAGGFGGGLVGLGREVRGFGVLCSEMDSQVVEWLVSIMGQGLTVNQGGGEEYRKQTSRVKHTVRCMISHSCR